MNFLPCTLDGNMARVDGVGIPLDDKMAAMGQKARGRLELGIRPLGLEMHAEAVADAVPARVKAVEDQGSFKILTVTLAGHTLRARLPEEKSIPQTDVWLRFPPRWTKLFADDRLVSG
jgi:glycerol transport system ATP-binding protein